MELVAITIGAVLLGFALWQMMFGGGPPTDRPDNGPDGIH
jgi:hypothetical protein